jgi:hypothetical protein
LGLSAARRAAGSGPSLADGLLAFWRLDGNRLDSSGNGRTLVQFQPVTYSTGLIGQCMSGGEASAVGSWMNSTEYAFSFWFQPGVDQNDDFVTAAIRTDSDYYVQAISNNSGQYRVAGISTGFTHDVSSSTEWVHVVITFDATGLEKLYVNGAMMDSYQNTPLGVADGITLSCFNDRPGTIDLAGVWNRVLTPADVSALHNAGAGFDPTV